MPRIESQHVNSAICLLLINFEDSEGGGEGTPAGGGKSSPPLPVCNLATVHTVMYAL